VRWCKWLNCWVTAAEDETIRLWDTDGVQLREFVYRGGTMTAMYVDNKRELLLCAMTDKAIRGYELEEGNLVHCPLHTRTHTPHAPPSSPAFIRELGGGQRIASVLSAAACWVP
jgi:hypothetical protein